jgi:hypothetical protein
LTYTISQLARSKHPHCNAAGMVDVQGEANAVVDDGSKDLTATSNTEAGIEELDISKIEKIYK